MREGWEDVALGQLICRRSDFTTVNPHADYVILGVQRSGWGFVQRESIKGSAQKFAKLMRVHIDDLVYRTITAFEAPSAVAGPEQAGLFVTPPTFPVYTINRERLLPAYMRLLTTWPKFHNEMAARCTGTVLRRKTLSVGAFESIPVPLPPLPEQRRIVDLVGVLDHTIAAAEASSAALGAIRSNLLDILPGEPVRLADVLERIDTGRSPSGIERTPKSGERAVLKVSAIGPAGFVPTEVKVVAPEEQLPSGSDVRAGDVLMVRSSGAIGRVGVTCRVPASYPNLYLCDKTLRLVPCEDRLDAHWLNAALSSTKSRQQLMTLATGSDMRNISQKAIMQVVIPLPPRAVLKEFSGLIESQTAAQVQGDVALRHLRALRSHLLSGLLTGEHQIPSSYDALVGDVT